MASYSPQRPTGLDSHRCDADSLGGVRNAGSAGFFKSSEFETEKFPSLSLSSKDYCPYSIRQSQLSADYQYDVLLIYDPEENSFYVDKLMECLEPQNLKVFDFARDSPPGLPQRKVLQSALQTCRYTCIVITKKFISNFWLQLKTDMSIQDMLDNEQKLYSVIVVVMDLAVTRKHLPLDLATLSPLFYSEKFFENRIKLAFSKDTPFPFSHPPSDFKKPMAVKQNEAEYSQCLTAPFKTKPNGSDFHGSRQNAAMTDMSNSRVSVRSPQEHGVTALESLPPSYVSTPSFGLSAEMHRAVSITVNSTGCREPTESSDISLFDRAEALEFRMVTSRIMESNSDGYSIASQNSSLSNHCLRKDDPSCESCQEDNFSALVNSGEDSGASLEDNQNQSHDTCQSTNFNVIESHFHVDAAMPVFSELEISVDPLPTVNEAGDSPCEQRCKSTAFVPSSVENKRLQNVRGGKSCTSLPAQLQNDDVYAHSNKKSHSMLSLINERIFKVKKSFSFRRNKNH